MDKEELLNKITQINNVKGGAIISKDGLVTANKLPDSVDANLVGAVISSIHSKIGEQTKRMKRGGEPKRFTIETEDETFSVVKYPLGSDEVLVIGNFDNQIQVEQINSAINSIIE